MGGQWTTADYALIVSLCSATISLVSLFWNIWSKFVFPKPRVSVSIAFSYAVGDGGNWPDAIQLTAVNHGPIEVTLKSAVGLVERGLFSTKKRALIRAFENWPYSVEECAYGSTPGLPKRIPVGESFSAFFPASISQSKELTNMGFIDGFGREHFAGRASRRNFRSSKS